LRVDGVWSAGGPSQVRTGRRGGGSPAPHWGAADPRRARCACCRPRRGAGLGPSWATFIVLRSSARARAEVVQP